MSGGFAFPTVVADLDDGPSLLTDIASKASAASVTAEAAARQSADAALTTAVGAKADAATTNSAIADLYGRGSTEYSDRVAGDADKVSKSTTSAQTINAPLIGGGAGSLTTPFFRVPGAGVNGIGGASANGELTLWANGFRYQANTTQFYPTDGQAALGRPSNRWGTVYATGGDFSGAVTFASGAINKIGTDNLNATSSGVTYHYVGTNGIKLNNQANTATLLTIANDGSVAFGGTVTLPTPATSDVSTKGATTAYVDARITTLINGAPAALDTLKEIGDQLASDESAVSALTTTVAGKLAKASNLSDLPNAATARTNLGLGTASTYAAGSAPGNVPILGGGGSLAIQGSPVLTAAAFNVPNGIPQLNEQGALVGPVNLDNNVDAQYVTATTGAGSGLYRVVIPTDKDYVRVLDPTTPGGKIIGRATFNLKMSEYTGPSSYFTSSATQSSAPCVCVTLTEDRPAPTYGFGIQLPPPLFLGQRYTLAAVRSSTHSSGAVFISVDLCVVPEPYVDQTTAADVPWTVPANQALSGNFSVNLSATLTDPPVYFLDLVGVLAQTSPVLDPGAVGLCWSIVSTNLTKIALTNGIVGNYAND